MNEIGPYWQNMSFQLRRMKLKKVIIIKSPDNR